MSAILVKLVGVAHHLNTNPVATEVAMVKSDAQSIWCSDNMKARSVRRAHDSIANGIRKKICKVSAATRRRMAGAITGKDCCNRRENNSI